MEVPQQIKDAIVSAILGEVANRSISFLVGKYCKRPAAPTEEERLGSLQRLLLRVRAVVEEAEGRRITSPAMLQQLVALSKEMYRGYYTLDTFRCRSAHEGNQVSNSSGSGLGHYFTLSNFSPAKRLCVFSSTSDESVKELQEVVASVETVVENVAEFIMLSGRYPRLFRQPYSMHLILDKCMFARQMEMELVINFLLLQADQTATSTPGAGGGGGAGHLGVLPILGPGKVGKTTLVEQLCVDDRVRDHFSETVFFTGDDLVSLGVGRVIKHRDGGGGAPADEPKRILIVVELDGDIDEDAWTRFYSASTRRVARDSKIVLTSRSDKAASFGTELPLRLQFLTQEAFWYLFKVRTFGSTDAAEHPKLAAVAMEIARELDGCFMGANIFGGILKSNIDARFWRLVLATYRVFRRKNRFLYSPPAPPVDPWAAAGPIHIPRLISNATAPAYNFVVLDIFETGEARVPKMMVQDVMFGSARPRGKFAALAWRSHLPPHYSYVCNCQRVVTRKKRNHQRIVGSSI